MTGKSVSTKQLLGTVLAVQANFYRVQMDEVESSQEVGAQGLRPIKSQEVGAQGLRPLRNQESEEII